jgi:hypothetical protein
MVHFGLRALRTFLMMWMRFRNAWNVAAAAQFFR